MTQQELRLAFLQLGLQISETECEEIAEAVQFIEEMRHAVRKPRSMTAEPAHIASFVADIK